jgi:hypothetical protein
MHKEFEVHILNPEGIQKARELAAAFDDLLTKIDTLVGPSNLTSRNLAITRTKLEEACFFAKKAIASLPENQKEKV